MKIEGSGSGSISQRHGSPDPDPHQNVMDPQTDKTLKKVFLSLSSLCGEALLEANPNEFLIGTFYFFSLSLFFLYVS